LGSLSFLLTLEIDLLHSGRKMPNLRKTS